MCISTVWLLSTGVEMYVYLFLIELEGVGDVFLMVKHLWSRSDMKMGTGMVLYLWKCNWFHLAGVKK